MVTTLKQAKAEGYRELRDDEYGGLAIVVKGHTLVKDPERAKSKSEWLRDGRKVIPSAKPHATISRMTGGGRVEYEVFREEQTTAKRPKPATKAADPNQDLLAAIFAVNRAAKRWRNTASAQYESGAYGFASRSKSHKQWLYHLKDRGIAQALSVGRLTAQEIHGGLCLYRGEGYCFHSSLVPVGADITAREGDQPLMVEAKPQGTREPRQCDAIACLEALPEVDCTMFSRLAVPKARRNRASMMK